MKDDDDHRLEDEALTDDAHIEEHDETETDGEQGGDEERAAREAEATKLGWKPKENWKGDQSGWVDADTFLDRLKPTSIYDRLERTSGELAQLKRERQAERQSFEDRLARLDKMNQASMERQRKQLIGQAKAAQRIAAEEGDVEAYDHWAQQEAQLTEELDKEAQSFAPEEPKRQAQSDPTAANWVKANPAVRYNKEKWEAAQAFCEEVLAENPAATVADQLAHAETRLNEIWPGTIRSRGKPKANGNGNGKEPPRQPRGPQLESGSRMPSRQRTQKGWSDIPAEERSIISRHIKEGLYKDQDDAAKQYWS